ncbi:sodium:sulfate symporter [Halarcobacter ebronensis]|uniref:Sodium:sulfate symporter n=1 Tax=Halarcobacter ebronensis TaxID=1462615 RepID=A0A4Q0YA60_9BACT|nr:SLC13 family permease [Halarcobacter ebronensis]RXJ66384.1 sodium:sulfate symporter [Halarcobacter ebronensis]
MLKNISIIVIPVFIYLILSNFIVNQKDIILISTIATTIIFWATNLVPSFLSSLLFLFSCTIFSLSSKEIIFSGFSSSAFWLVFAGMLIASAIKNVNLTNRVSKYFANIKNISYLNLIVSIAIFSTIFSFIMPSSVGRVVLMVPISIAVANSFGFKENDKGYIGILLAFILTTSMSGFTILPANVPNMILSGLASQIYNYEILYSHYLVSNFIILGFLKNIIIVGLIYYFFNDKAKISSKNKTKVKLDKNEIIVLITIFIMILFWATDFIHKISPSIIAICGIIFLGLPFIGIIKTEDLNSLKFSSLLFVATVIGLGSVVANSDFIRTLLSNAIDFYEPSEYEIINYLKVSLFMSLTGIFTTQPTIPAIFTPLAQHISDVTGFNLNQIFMMQVAAYSNIFFSYQAPPLIVGLALAKIKQKYVLKILITTAIITTLFLYPLEYFWIKLLNI